MEWFRSISEPPIFCVKMGISPFYFCAISVIIVIIVQFKWFRFANEAGYGILLFLQRDSTEISLREKQTWTANEKTTGPNNFAVDVKLLQANHAADRSFLGVSSSILEEIWTRNPRKLFRQWFAMVANGFLWNQCTHVYPKIQWFNT